MTPIRYINKQFFIMDIKVSPLDESSYTYDDVIALMHASFEERLKQGLRFTCSAMTVSEFRKRTKNGIVFVAWNAENHELQGTATVTLCKNKKGVVYGYNEYLAISPSAKRHGIGTKLLDARIDCILKAGGKYVMSDTALGAESSINWHLKNGFKKVSLRSFGSTNYYSIIFRKQLAPSLLWNSIIYTSFRFWVTSIMIKSIYKKDGSMTCFGKLTKFIRR